MATGAIARSSWGNSLGQSWMAQYDFVIGSRTRGRREPGSMNFQQVFSGRVAGFLLGLLYGVRYTDMCPFRAIRRDSLARLGMKEPTYGWNLEMQMRAARAGLRILEVPVDHRCRTGGESKVSGTLRGTFVAGARILATLFRVAAEKTKRDVLPAAAAVSNGRSRE